MSAGILRTTSFTAKRMRKCTICRTPFPPRSMTHKVCCGECGLKLAALTRAKAERKTDKARKNALKSRGDWIAEVQTAFNAFIRARDANQPCICCGKPFEPQKFGGSMDAGHYLSRGSAPHLRFDERNVHGQRKNCNRPGGTTRDAFTKGMEARIGIEALEALECDQASRDWTIADLIALKAEYKLKLKGLQDGAH